MLRFRLVVAVLAVFSLLATACFQIIGFTYKDPLSPGEKGKIVVDLGPFSSSNNTTAIPFLVVGTAANLDQNGTSKFDLKVNFGGKYASTSDNTLRNLALAGGECDAGGLDADDIEGSFSTWRAFRTSVTVNSGSGALGTPFRVKVKIQRSGGANNSSANFVIFSGSWVDDGDGIVESGEIICTGLIQGAIPFTS